MSALLDDPERQDLIAVRAKLPCVQVDIVTSYVALATAGKF